MDLLDPADRAFLAGVLTDMFEPAGCGHAFVVIALAKDGNGMMVPIRSPNCTEPLDAKAIIQGVALAETKDEFGLEG